MSVKGMAPLEGLSLLQRQQEVTKIAFHKLTEKHMAMY